VQPAHGLESKAARAAFGNERSVSSFLSDQGGAEENGWTRQKGAGGSREPKEGQKRDVCQ
jgi:hypothetical protein